MPHLLGALEYDAKVREIVRDHQIDVNAGRENYTFIQDFVVKHLDGIKLKNAPTGRICSFCSKK